MILSAGRGSRMGKVSLTKPKPLTMINGLTLIENNILRIKESGIYEIIINVSWLGHKIINFLGNGEKYNVKIYYSDEQDKLLGTGGGVYNALDLLGDDPFWLINSDIYTSYKIRIDKKIQKNKLCHLVLVPNPRHHLEGDFDLLNNSVIYNKKKVNNYTFSGISIISPKLFVKRKKSVFALEPILRQACKKNLASGEVYNGFWMDIGTQNRLNYLRKKLENSKALI